MAARKTLPTKLVSKDQVVQVLSISYSIREAAKELNIDQRTLSGYCKSYNIIPKTLLQGGGRGQRKLGWKHKPTVKICIHCGKEFTIPAGIRPRKATCNTKCFGDLTSKRQQGFNNSHYKGGKASEDMRVRNSRQAKAWRTTVFERDDYMCQVSGCKHKRGNYIVAHHVLPWVTYEEYRTSLWNGVTLCPFHHAALHDRKAPGSEPQPIPSVLRLDVLQWLAEWFHLRAQAHITLVPDADQLLQLYRSQGRVQRLDLQPLEIQ